MGAFISFRTFRFFLGSSSGGKNKENFCLGVVPEGLYTGESIDRGRKGSEKLVWDRLVLFLCFQF
jgi:hypothetical protein